MEDTTPWCVLQWNFTVAPEKREPELSRKFVRGLIHAAGESPAPQIENEEKSARFPGLRNRRKTKSKPAPRRTLGLVSVPHSG